MLRRLYDWTMRLAAHRHATWALAIVAFAESSCFPLPPDLLLFPMVLAERRRAWWYATVCTAASVLGGCAGYAIGYFLWQAVGQPILDFYGYAEKFETVRGWYNDWGAWIVFTAGVSPIPYKVFTIASGVSALSLPIFFIASALGRGLRFFVVAGLLYRFGEPIRAFIERWLGLLSILFVVLLVGGFLLIKLL